ncbi:MAG: hypothetical protein OHK0046_36960 [Anaerolineae bacterium]
MQRKIQMFILVMLLGVLVSGAYAQDSLPVIIPTDYARVEAFLSANAPLRVVVGVNAGAVQPEGQLFGQRSVQNQRQQIAQAQVQLLSALGKTTTSPSVHVFETIPFVALTVTQAELQALQNSPIVTSVNLNQRVYPMLQSSIPLIGADVTSANGLTGAGQYVAVLDTGVDAQHPFFEGRVVHEACFSTDEFPYVTNCPNGTNEQIGPGAARACEGRQGCFHGTHVAGIVAGNSDARELRGVAPEANIVGVQVFSGISPYYCLVAPDVCNAVTSSFEDTVRGLEYVYQLVSDESIPIASVNMSLGTTFRYTGECPGVFAPMDAIIANLRSAGVATIIASGNSSFTDGISWPACAPGVVSVGASDDNDSVASFSNSGPIIDLLAPGVDIGSAVPPGTNPDDPSIIYARARGTSMAAPHVAGAWAVLRQADPDASIDDILTALQISGSMITDSRNDLIQARIQVDDAVTALQNGVPPRYRVLINEVQLQGTQAVEIYNADTVAANLGGWAVDFYSGSTLEYTYTFPANFTLGIGQFVTLLRGTGSNTSNTLYMGSFTSTWQNAASGAVLLRSSVIGVDFMKWGEADVMPLIGTAWTGNDPAAPPIGSSLGRDQFSTDSDSGFDWFANTPPTLGSQNQTERPPSNNPDDFEGARVIDAVPYQNEMTTAQATASPDDPDPTCYQPPVLVGERVNRSVWYRYTAAEDRDLTFATAGTDYATILSIWTGEKGNLTMVACNEDVEGFPTYNDVTSIIHMRVKAGTTYHIMVSAGALLGQTGSSLKFSVTDAVTAVLVNDDFDGAAEIAALDYSVEMNISDSTVASDDPEPPCYQAVVGDNLNNTVWFRYTPPRNQALVLDTLGSAYGTILSVWKGERGTLTSVDCDDSGWTIFDGPESPNARLELDVQGGTTYHIMISAGGFLGINSGDLVFSVVDASPPNRNPVVTSLPAQSSTEGEEVSLPVIASDPDNEQITYIADNLPPGLTIDPVSGLISGTVSYFAAGTYTSTITVVDRGQLENSTIFNWVVTNVNRAPLVESLADQISIEGDTVSVQIIASDPDYDLLHYQVTGLPDGAVLEANTGLINGTLTTSSAGIYTVIVTVTDNGTPNTESTSATFTWEVGDVNGDYTPMPTITMTSTSSTPTPTSDTNPLPTETLSPTATATLPLLEGMTRIAPAEGTVIAQADQYVSQVQWAAQPDAAWYHVFISTPDFTTIYQDKWYEASEVCSGQICTSPDPVWITSNGQISWWMTYWNEMIGEDYVDLYEESAFYVNFDLPGAVNGDITASGLVSWSHDPQVLWYHVWFGPSSYERTDYLEWLEARTICNDSTCSLSLGNLASGSYELWLELWSPAGLVAWQRIAVFDDSE